MSYPIKVCAICSEEFELKPGKPGFANHCPDCSEDHANNPELRRTAGGAEKTSNREMDAERRKAIRDLLYRKDS